MVRPARRGMLTKIFSCDEFSLDFSIGMVYNDGEGKVHIFRVFSPKASEHATEQDQWVSRETAAPPGLERSNELQQAIVPLFLFRKGGFSLRGMYGRKIWAGSIPVILHIFLFHIPPYGGRLGRRRRLPASYNSCEKREGPPTFSFFVLLLAGGAIRVIIIMYTLT